MKTTERAAYERDWRKANPEKIQIHVARRRDWRRANPEKTWARKNPEKAKAASFRYGLRRRYGMTPEDYGVLLGKQEGLCAICANVLDRGRHTHVDHDHKTGAVRGLLCGHCNVGLGHLQDSADTLRLAINYVEFHQKVG